MFRFIDAVLREIQRNLEEHNIGSVPSLYIGGGTPSLLGAEGIACLMKGLRGILPGGLPAGNVPEITVEANPESADDDFLAACKEGGINRISIGVQTFSPESRNSIGRIGDAALLPGRLEAAAAAFGSSFSADLMTGLPFQDQAVLSDDIARLLEYRPGHVSLYALTLEEDSPLYSSARRGRGRLPKKDAADSLWICGRDALERAGYEQYEVSNFALPGFECRHNMRYWEMENWIGVGPSASGTIFNEEEGSARRFTCSRSVSGWFGLPPKPAEEYIDARTLAKEMFLMGFRCLRGPKEELFIRRFGRSLGELIPKSAAAWRERGLLQSGAWALTKEGLLFLDSFLVDAFEELDAPPLFMQDNPTNAGRSG